MHIKQLNLFWVVILVLSVTFPSLFAANIPSDSDQWTDMETPYRGSIVDEYSPAGGNVLFVADTNPFSIGDKIAIGWPYPEENEVVGIYPNYCLICKNYLIHSYLDDIVSVYPGWRPSTGFTTVTADSTLKVIGSRSVKTSCSVFMYWMGSLFHIGNSSAVNANEYPRLRFYIRLDQTSSADLTLWDVNGRWAGWGYFDVPNDDYFHYKSFPCGAENEELWSYVESGFDWTRVIDIDIRTYPPYYSGMSFWIDGLRFSNEGAHETRYMRSDQHTINGLTAYKLDITQTSSNVFVGQNYVGDDFESGSWGIRVWKRTTSGAETEVTSGAPQAQVSRVSKSSGIQSATWVCPQTTLNLIPDSTVVRVYIRINSFSWVLKATFTTQQ